MFININDINSKINNRICYPIWKNDKIRMIDVLMCCECDVSSMNGRAKEIDILWNSEDFSEQQRKDDT